MTARQPLRLRPNYIAWLLGYLAVIAAICSGVAALRSRVLQVMGTAEEARRWQNWRENAQDAGDTGGVARRPPKSSEPPALVLMRDHIWVIVAAALVFGTVFYLLVMMLAYGMLRSSWGHSDPSPPARAGVPKPNGHGSIEA